MTAPDKAVAARLAERTLSKAEVKIFAALHHLQADGSIDRAMVAEALNSAAGELSAVYRTLAAQPDDAAAGDAWQPIETAPKDGTSILALWGKYPPRIIHWKEGDGPFGPFATWLPVNANTIVLAEGPRLWQPIPEWKP